MRQRNYREEYKEFHSRPEQIARRSARNKARRKLEAAGKVRKGDGKDVDHKDQNPHNNHSSNLRVKSPSKNRSLSSSERKKGRV